MKTLFVLLVSLSSALLHGASDTYSLERLTGFYNVFSCEEKQKLADAGLTTPCFPLPLHSFSPPPIPPPPAFKTGLLPIVIVNTSGFPDEQVYILLTGNTVDNTSQVWGNVNTSVGANFGNVTLQNVASGDNGSSFSYPLSSLPLDSSGRVIYVPQVRTGLIWFSIGSKLNMPATSSAPFTIVQPSFTNPADPNYATNFDIFEFTYLLSGAPQVAADATAVSFFSIPLHGFLAGATSSSSTTGLFLPRSFIMSFASSQFNAAPLSAQWNRLLLTQGGTILRCLAPGKAIAASLFDANYLVPYLSDIWNGGPSSFYRTHSMSLTVAVTSPSTATFNYTGSVNPATNTFDFTSSNGGPAVTFPAPVTAPTPTGTTTFNIFSAVNFITPLPAAGTAGDAVSKLVQEAIIAGLVPTTDTLSLSYLSSNQSNFYKINNNVSASIRNSGPWFDLYSKTLHSLGSIYTYGFDEPLWPQVLLGAPFINNTTYLGITIGNSK